MLTSLHYSRANTTQHNTDSKWSKKQATTLTTSVTDVMDRYLNSSNLIKSAYYDMLIQNETDYNTFGFIYNDLAAVGFSDSRQFTVNSYV